MEIFQLRSPITAQRIMLFICIIPDLLKNYIPYIEIKFNMEDSQHMHAEELANLTGLKEIKALQIKRKIIENFCTTK